MSCAETAKKRVRSRDDARVWSTRRIETPFASAVGCKVSPARSPESSRLAILRSSS